MQLRYVIFEMCNAYWIYVILGSRSTHRVLNRRKLRELPAALVRAERWDKLTRLLCDLPFIEAKFEAGQGTFQRI